jgi:thiamine biosynthesis lipoprotein
LRASRHFFELSGGAFNPAIGPLVELWREAERRGSEPTADELAALKPACTMDAFEFDAEKRTCTKLMAGARLDVGAIAKGYAVDRVVELLQARGVASGIVTSGGEVRVFGGTVSRRVGIKDPEKPEALYGYFYCTAGAVSTSGNYERFYTVAGRTYGHIVDPRSFKPTEGPLSVTVLAQNATTSDALSTTIYVLGADEGLKLVETLPGVEALVLVREDGAIKQRRSRGFPEVLDMSELEQPAEE